MTILERMDRLEKRLDELEKRAQCGGSMLIVRDKEHDRVVEKMKQLRDSYGQSQPWMPADKKLYAELKARRDELRQLLGIKI